MYLRPKSDSDMQSFFHQKGHKNDDSELTKNDPVFIGQLTSSYFFQIVKNVLKTSYKAKSYIERYKLEPLAIQTYDCSSECIDYMLTKPHQKLLDFLHSACNTNASQLRRDGSNVQLFDTSKMRKSGVINLTLQKSESLRKQKSLKLEGDGKILKLKVCFVDKEYLDTYHKEKKESVRKQSIKDYELIKILG